MSMYKVLYRSMILNEMIDMNNRKFDIKITPLFTGVIVYKKEDYLDEKTYVYSFHYNGGILSFVSVHVDGTLNDENPIDIRGTKFLDADRFNGEFWLKAPKYLHFDDCRWERDYILLGLDVVTAQPLGVTCLQP